MSDKLGVLIARYETDGEFTHVVPTAEMLEEAHNRLGVVIPQRLIDYLVA